jgi:hypothetical protein
MIRRLLIALVLVAIGAQAHASSNGILTQSLSSSTTTSSGGSTSLSALTSATGAHTITNGAFAQEWDSTALIITATGATTPLTLTNTGNATFVVTGNASLSGTTTIGTAQIGAGNALFTTVTATNGEFTNALANTITSTTDNTSNLVATHGYGANTTLSLSTTTFTPNLTAAQSYLAALTTACVCAIANPSNISSAVGQTGIIEIDQPLTATTTVTWGSQYKFSSGTSPTLSTTTGAQDYFSYYVKDSTHVVVSGGVLNAH